MSIFRPCIDLHQGKVKQIIGSTLTSNEESTQQNTKINFESSHPAEYFAKLYQKDQLKGGHLIQLGQNTENKNATLKALAAYPQGLQVGGGIHLDNAAFFIDQGASQVIVTSYIFPNGIFNLERLKSLALKIGKEKLVIDLSCKAIEKKKWMVVINGWGTFTNTEVNQNLLRQIEPYCYEILVHATHVEGLSQGIDKNLVKHLSNIISIPTTYAGGVKQLQDLYDIRKISSGTIDITVGSSLDLFGGHLIKYDDCLKFNLQ